MDFKYIDNTPIFKDFMNQYGEKVKTVFPILNNVEIETRIMSQEEENGETSDDLNDTPFYCNVEKKQILRSDKECNIYQLDKGEEMAIIAHEIGHIIIAHNGMSLSHFDEEKQADIFAAQIVGPNNIENALQKLYTHFHDSKKDALTELLCPTVNGKEELLKRLQAIREKTGGDIQH